MNSKLNPSYSIPYLPDILIKSCSARSVPDDCSMIECSLLFADLSGFTAMSEKLAQLGRIGGEKLAEIMNGCFDSLLGLVFSADGDIIRFGGDAFLAMFTGKDDCLRASRCAAELINWIEGNGTITTGVGEFKLGIHAGLNRGLVYNLYLGTTRKDHLFCGDTVEKTYAAADIAGLGELAVTQEAGRSLGDIKFDSSRDGHYIRNIFTSSGHPQPTKRNQPISHTSVIPSTLNSFLITGLDQQLHYNNGQVEGEHRILTSLFIGIDSIRKNLEADTDRSTPVIHEFHDKLNVIIECHGGAFARMDSSGSSEKMLIFFGAPQSRGLDAANCLEAIIEIKSLLPRINKKLSFPLKLRYGVNSGLCFVGDVGGKYRREYTAMGDAINLAARLMSKADYGDVYIGDETYRSCKSDFQIDKIGYIDVKGKSKPVMIYSLTGEKAHRRHNETIIGREDEIRQAERFITALPENVKKILLVSGEPGAGKSLLSEKIKSIATDHKLNAVESACFRHTSDTPYAPFKTVLQGLLKLPHQPTKKLCRQKLKETLQAIGNAEWECLIGPLLDYYPPVPPEIRNLPEDIKKSKITAVLGQMICYLSKLNRNIIFIDDIQWIDNTSLELTKSIIRSEDAPGFVFISRPSRIYEQLKSKVSSSEIFLSGLSDDYSKLLFQTILGHQDTPNSTLDKIVEKSGGNPFYLEEMAKAFIELGPEKFSADGGIPSQIESVITARIDNLGEMVKKTIRTASVIGRVFNFSVLKSIFPDRKRTGKLPEYIKELAHLDLTPLERSQPVIEYIFKHILTQEVAYNGLSFSARKKLHLQTADFYATRKRLAKINPDIPARHYLIAEEEAKALPFFYLAGNKAASEFANDEALKFYDKVITLSKKLGDHQALIKTYRRRGTLSGQIGDFETAEKDFLAIKNLAENDLELLTYSLKQLSLIYRKTAKYDKASQTIDELENYGVNNPELEVFCLNGRGEITRRRGQLADCRTMLLKALKIGEENAVPSAQMAVLYNNLGICYWGLGKLTEANKYYKQAYRLYRQLKDLSGQSKITNNMGILSDEMGKLNIAAKSYEKAEKIFKRTGESRSEAFACANLGTNLTTRGLLADSYEKLIRAKMIFEKIGDLHSLAYITGDIGDIYYHIFDKANAIIFYNDAMQKARKLKDEEFILLSKIRILNVEIDSGEVAPSMIDPCIKSASKIGSTELELKALLAKAKCAINHKEYSQAEDSLSQLQANKNLSSYPAIELEGQGLKLFSLSLTSNSGKHIEKYEKLLKRAYKKELISSFIDLWIQSSVLGYADALSGKTKILIENIYNRIADCKLPNSQINYKVAIRRKIAAFNLRANSPTSQPVASHRLTTSR